MDEQQVKAILKATFDTVSGGYDGKALSFFPVSAEHMVSLLGLRGNEHVLDVACGTGHAALAIAKLLPTGHVTAVDFSTGMLDRAQRKAVSLDDLQLSGKLLSSVEKLRTRDGIWLDVGVLYTVGTKPEGN